MLAVIVADSEVALTAMDGYVASFEGAAETAASSTQGVNVVLTLTVRRLHS